MKQNPFLQKKAAILESIKENSPDSPDASPKGTIDILCMPIINLINSSPNMVTTSTCSGRVSVFLEGSKIVSESSNVKAGGKGEGGKWLFVTHDVNELDGWDDEFLQNDVHQLRDPEAVTNAGNDIATRYLLFKFEPLILHVLCADYPTACELYSTAMGCGFRESGIGKNNNVAIRVSIRLDVPIGYLDEKTGEINVFVEQYVLKVLTQMSRDKFHQNTKKLQELHESIEKMMSMMSSKPDKKQETKEERRHRKIQEGMARRDAVLQQKALARKKKLEEEEKAKAGQLSEVI
ncbi:tRNA methyltransferase [Saccharomycopsis crataegensis]|uniref:tRNA wybutosine-synthesizing protein 3 n=1 Tax=Saccharomycopsis crataegensis TaxID=43959 RepID=A0AAV5QPC0_9ASCO|nr:tRNA methyltransferase [Saccharomycopsis crataegensis]